MRECLDCGMQLHSSITTCLKCDAVLNDQTDGSMITVDIAHHGERVHDAIRKLDQVLQSAEQGYTLAIRLIVGHGVIKEEVIGRLQSRRRSGKIRNFDFDGNNQGVLLIFIR